MAADFTYDGTKIVTANGTEGVPKTFADMHDADIAGSLELLAAETCTTNHTLSTQIQPAEQMALQLSFILDSTAAGAGDTLDITGTDNLGNAQTESIDVSGGDDTYTGDLTWQTISDIDCTGWADGTLQVTQPRWGVVWEIAEDSQYKINCNIDFGDGTTSTYFQSKNEMIYFANGKVPVIKDNATLELGDPSGDWSIDGSCWSMKVEDSYSMIENGSTNAVFKTYGSMIIERDVNIIATRFYSGTWIARNFIYSGFDKNDGAHIKIYSGSVDWKDIRLFNTRGFYNYVTPTNFDNVHIHNSRFSLAVYATQTIPNLNVTDSTTEVYITGVITLTVKDPKFHLDDVVDLVINSAGGIIIEQYTCNIHVTDKDGADLEDVDVDCEYAHLVEGSDAKTYKCIQDHTSVDATHKPITGSDWASFWELYDAGGGLGGPWQTTFDFKAGTQEFAQDTTDANGDITEQTIDYKKWVGTSEILEARIHKFTFSHASYPDLTIEDVIVSIPLVWRIDMGQSTSNLTTIVDAAITANADIDTIDGVVDAILVDTAGLNGAAPAPSLGIEAQGFVVKEKNLTFTVQAIAGTGAVVDATGDVSYSVYEDETATAILTGTMAKLASQTGFYSEQIACTGENGFELFKTYTIRVTATVGGIAVATVGNFMCVGKDDIMRWSGLTTQRGA